MQSTVITNEPAVDMTCTE
uniref:Uncharacterized protein n=1 Tax=Anguilla anguilla TaxID=7936 RepID=A0A0E9RB11_ANGAN